LEPKKSNEDTLEVVDNDGDTMKLKVEDGLIKIGYKNDNESSQLTWDLTSKIKVQHFLQADAQYYKLTYDFKNEHNTWKLQKFYMDQISNFFDLQVSENKLTKKELSESCIEYEAKANEDTLTVADIHGNSMEFKVEDGLMKIGYKKNNTYAEFEWYYPTKIKVKYPYSSPKQERSIDVAYTFKNTECLWSVANEYKDKMSRFFNLQVTENKLTQTIFRGSGIQYEAKAQRSTSTPLQGATRMYMNQLNPYLLHETGRP